MVDNSDSFFEGLPQAKNPNRGRFLFSKKKDPNAAKREQLKKEQEALALQLQKKQQLLDELEQRSKAPVDTKAVYKMFTEVESMNERYNPTEEDLRPGEKLVSTASYGNVIVQEEHDPSEGTNIITNVDMDRFEEEDNNLSEIPIAVPLTRKRHKQNKLDKSMQ